MLELLILGALGLWLAMALRFCRRHRGGCGGDCARCTGCDRIDSGKSKAQNKAF